MSLRHLVLAALLAAPPVWADKPTAPDAVQGARNLDAEQVVALLQVA